MLAAAAVYLAAYASLPSDGTVIDWIRAPQPAGLLVKVERSGGALRTGDLVVAVDGQPVDDLITAALRQPWLAPPAAATLDYTVVRAGTTLVVRQALARAPLSLVLLRNWTTFFFLAYFLVVAGLVFVLRPRRPEAQLLLVFVVCIVASSLMFFLGLPLSALRHGWAVYLWLLGAIVFYGFLAGNGMLFPMVFPRVWDVLRRRRILAAAAFVGVWVPFLAHAAAGWPSAAGASSRLLLAIRATSAISVTVFPLVVLGSVVSHRLVKTERERRQLRWVLWGMLVSILPWVALDAVPQALGLPALLPPLVVGLLWMALPTSFAISILRERLFDIDVILNRSLVYGALSVVLAVGYFGAVVVLQGLFQAITGEQRSQLATVLSTLAIAAAFSPLRQGLQHDVDRRFFRRKYDAAWTLAAFGASLRDEVDLSSLTERLVGVVHDTMEPTQAWLWLPRQGRPAARATPPSGGPE